LKILVLSNDIDPLPNITRDERRYFSLEISDAHLNDKAYFGALEEELDHGGAEAMLFELLNRSIEAYDIRTPPTTETLIEQQGLDEDEIVGRLRDCGYENAPLQTRVSNVRVMEDLGIKLEDITRNLHVGEKKNTAMRVLGWKPVSGRVGRAFRRIKETRSTNSSAG
jgi:hypothetical protein